MNRVRRTVIAIATALFVAPVLAAGPVAPPEPTVILIGRDDYKVLGASVNTIAAMVKLLADNNVKLVDIRVDEDIGYERIGKVIYTLSRYGVDIHQVIGKLVNR